MPKTDYNEFAELSLESIYDNGSDIEIIRNEGVLVDASKPWLGETIVPISYPANGVLLSVTNADYQQYPKLTSITVNKKILVDPVRLQITPLVGDKVKHDGVEWFVASLGQIKPATTTVLWTLFVSR